MAKRGTTNRSAKAFTRISRGARRSTKAVRAAGPVFGPASQMRRRQDLVKIRTS